VARELVAECLAGGPPPSPRQIHERLLRAPFDRPTADRADLLAAYDRELGLQNLRRLCPPVPPGLRGKLPVVRGVAPPVYKLTSGTPRVGFVNFDAQADRDGTLRRMPLMVEWEGRLLEQLAFAAARDALGIRPEDLSIDASGRLVIAASADRPAMRIQIDEKGRMLINWHARAESWDRCFAHLPVARLLQVHDIRQAVRNNERLKQARLGEAMRLVKDDAAFAGYRDQVARLLDRRRCVRAAMLRGAGDAPDVQAARAEAEQLSRAIEADHEMTAGFIRQTWADLQKEPNPADPAIAEDYRRFRDAHQIIDDIIPEIDAINTSLASREAELVSQLRTVVAGKTCFLGYTATALADMVTAPPYDRMPGVLIHSHLFNCILQGRFRTWSWTSAQLAAILLFGLTVTVVSTLRSPRSSFVFVMVGIGFVLMADAFGLFGRWDHWLQMFTALALTFVVWAMIVMIRYLVTDRQRRRFSKAVARYVSPAMARRIAESGRDLSLAPVDAVVTCLFSDIAGFTTLSEELGPAGTRAVLNPYLEAMSGVLHRHQALINKFMGDGVFAFFNPPILPCPNHELAACEAALDSMAALVQLGARHAGTPLAPYFGKLSMRIGIASGPVFVGDYGSEDKLDYTCVGDVVNLAARLESANKQFGTGIMVDGSTQAAAGNRYLYRHLGILRVKGKTQGASVYELLGRRHEVDGEVLAYAERFDRAVLAFSRRDFSGAASGFEECLRRRPTDVAARRYLPAIRRFETEPPPSDWAGAIELTEK
jgi:adenylate cyclase